MATFTTLLTVSVTLLVLGKNILFSFITLEKLNHFILLHYHNAMIIAIDLLHIAKMIHFISNHDSYI